METIETLGLDISHYQNEKGKVDASKVFSAGKKFIIIKCTEGTSFIDPYYKANIEAFRKAGFVIFHYHFGRENSKELEWFLKNADIREGEGAMLDYESGTANNVKWCNEWKNAFFEKMKFLPLMYVKAGNGADWTPITDCGLVSARYGRNTGDMDMDFPPYKGQWKSIAIWQYTSKGKVDGISGDVDLDVFYGTLDQLKKYCRPFPLEPAEDPRIIRLEKISSAAQLVAGVSVGVDPSDSEVEQVVKGLNEALAFIKDPPKVTVTVEKPVETIIYKDHPETLKALSDANLKIENQKKEINNLLSNKSAFYQAWEKLKQSMIDFWNTKGE